MTVPSATSRTNEAAERLRDTLGGARQQWLDAALSEEQRRTVERVGHALCLLDWTDEQASAINDVLDEIGGAR